MINKLYFKNFRKKKGGGESTKGEEGLLHAVLSVQEIEKKQLSSVYSNVKTKYICHLTDSVLRHERNKATNACKKKQKFQSDETDL